MYWTLGNSEGPVLGPVPNLGPVLILGPWDRSGPDQLQTLVSRLKLWMQNWDYIVGVNCHLETLLWNDFPGLVGGEPGLHGDVPQLLAVLHPDHRLGRPVDLAGERRRPVPVDRRRPREALELRPLRILPGNLLRITIDSGFVWWMIWILVLSIWFGLIGSMKVYPQTRSLYRANEEYPQGSTRCNYSN